MSEQLPAWLDAPIAVPTPMPASAGSVLLPSMVTLDPFGPEEEAFILNMRRMERSEKTVSAYMWSLAMKALWIWLVRILIPRDVVVFGPGDWNLGGPVHLKKGQVIWGAAPGKNEMGLKTNG